MLLNRDNCEVSREEKIHFIIYITDSVTLGSSASDSEFN